MRWKIEFYNDSVKDSIMKWPEGIRAKFLWVANIIEEVGPADVGMPHIKALDRGLFEIRVKGKEGIGRALFCMVKGKVIIIFNDFIKKTKKTPTSEIALARKRMTEIKKDG